MPTETTKPPQATRRPPGTDESDRAVLRVSGLSKRFGGTQALKDVGLDIAHGEIHALIGPNGSGKSTLIKILAGYHHAEPGVVAELDGEPFDLGQVTGSRHDPGGWVALPPVLRRRRSPSVADPSVTAEADQGRTPDQEVWQ
ncbi:ATP-binding cassette domain-containing protein [Streptomyces sp. V4I2]|uniref:ATP-binding cassette domain-containing protein n=1 Tax=Streptomyces sp. V4I2 TaxID=3042280 RepID=UPI0027D8F713|nr:ATP-binding cassette domain-containing protein [Streptomyces sp. V4I2]